MEKWCQDMNFFMGLYHVEGRMIPALELLVDGIVDGYELFLQKQLPQVKAYSLSNIVESHEL